MKTVKTAFFNRFTVDMPPQAVADCSHQGRCDEDVEHWEPKIKIEATPDDIRAELKEYGAWDKEELQDDDQNRRRIIWLAAAQIHEDREDD